MRVLIVEDCPDTASSMAMLMQIWGYDHRVARDGFSAINLAAEFRPHVVLLDFQLPDFSGCEVAAAIRARVDSRIPYIISLSGRTDARHVYKTACLTCDLEFLKPIEPEILESVLFNKKKEVEPDVAPSPFKNVDGYGNDGKCRRRHR